jgi:hypothetical protein
MVGMCTTVGFAFTVYSLTCLQGGRFTLRSSVRPLVSRGVLRWRVAVHPSCGGLVDVRHHHRLGPHAPLRA